MWNLVLCVCGIYIMSGFNVVNFKKKNLAHLIV
jgi:hypothetical protein